MAFPTLSEHCVTKVEIEHENATIRTEFEAGYEQARERHFRNRRTVNATYVVKKQEDLDLILNHWKDVKGSISFAWTEPKTGEVMTVRYLDPPKVPYVGEWPNRFEIQLKMREL